MAYLPAENHGQIHCVVHLRVRENPGSNLGLETGYFDMFFVGLRSLCRKYRGRGKGGGGSISKEDTTTLFLIISNYYSQHRNAIRRFEFEATNGGNKKYEKWAS